MSGRKCQSDMSILYQKTDDFISACRLIRLITDKKPHSEGALNFSLREMLGVPIMVAACALDQLAAMSCSGFRGHHL